ncbi:MAG: hypothetical protein K2G55_08905, partial [Lachnospiraceae bacterium]|nr:hypothetical protein [Lachnospiraceae bacterium]
TTERSQQQSKSMTEGISQQEIKPLTARMSQEFVDERMEQIEIWMKQIDEGELALDTDEYEEYSEDYWDREWIVEYYDHQGIGDKLMSIIQFAKDCMDDRRYKEANYLYEWLWEMEVSADNEYVDDCDPADLQTLVESKIININLELLALQTLYADYQVCDMERRAEDIYLYFSHSTFQELHIEDMFHAGRENLTDTEQFWSDWIELLKSKSGDVEARLLQEAVLYHDGLDGLVKMADENCGVHPSLYLTVMKEFDKKHDYEQIEKVGERAVEKIDRKLKIRSEVALKAAQASGYLAHSENVMSFCWECFRSDSTVRNFLRLFGTKEMAEQYGIRAKEILNAGIRGRAENYIRNVELCQNLVNDYRYYELCFYAGDFEADKKASSNPQGSLGWSSCFIGRGIRLFLLYLYENFLPSKAAAVIAGNVGFSDQEEQNSALHFESAIIEECRGNKTSVFWNYFKRWKLYFPMEETERKEYLTWAEKIVSGRADAIVGGQHRNHYGDSAALLAMVAEIKEQMGIQGAKREIFAQYKTKFPRHSAFQGEMKKYFNMK